MPPRTRPYEGVATHQSEASLRTNIRSNTIPVGAAPHIALAQNGSSTVKIEGLTGLVSIPATVETFLNSLNPPTSSLVSIAPSMSILGVPLGTCRIP